LTEIAGIGLRKSFEFLVKDFLITRNRTMPSKFKGKFLVVVIKEYVDDPRLKLTAERASWLGNDETHYVRKWEDKDIEDLKNSFALALTGLRVFC
jgi:hypothetical protein